MEEDISDKMSEEGKEEEDYDGVSYLYFMKNTGNITSTQNIEFKMRKS